MSRRAIRISIAAVAIAAAAMVPLLIPRSAASASPCNKPSIRVHKARGDVELYCEDALRSRFPATFGANPVGPKEREGDERTPEGEYTVTSRVKTPRFDRFLGVSYPNDEDRRRAREAGITKLGGGIGIHGTSKRIAGVARVFTRVAHATGLSRVWGPTDGCIGLVNEDVEVLYDAVAIGTPVVIEP